MDERTILVLMVSGGGFFSVILLAVAFGVAGSGDTRLKKRLNRLEGRLNPAQARMEQAISVRLNKSDSSVPTLNLILKAVVPKPEKLRTRLQATGLPIRLGEYVLATVILILFFTVMLRNLAGMAPVTSFAAGLGFGILIPHQVIGFLVSRRLAKFTKGFPDAIELMVRSLRSGLPLGEAFRNVGEELPDPLGVEFRTITDNIRLGMSQDDALKEAAQRLDTPDFKFFLTSVAIQRETGGNLAETLDGLAEIVRQRLQMKLKVKAMTSEARASAYILAALPITLFLIIWSVNPEYVGTFFETTNATLTLAGGGVSMIVGLIVMFKMASFEV